MIAPPADVVKRLRARVRATVKDSPALRREKKRAGRRQRHAPPWLLRTLWVVLAGGALAAASVSGLPPDAALHIFVLWALAIAFFRAGEIAALLYSPAHLWVPFLLPLADDVVFAEHRRHVLRSSAWIAVDALVFATVLLMVHGPGGRGWLALPFFAGAHWAGALATAAAFVSWNPRLPFGAIAGALMIGGYVTAQVFGNAPRAAALVRPLLDVLQVGTPAGWVQTAFARVLAGEWAVGLGVLAGLLALGAWILPHFTRLLRRRFSLERTFDSEAIFETVADERAADARPSAMEESPGAARPDEVAARIREELDHPPGLALFRRSFLERWITRSLSLPMRVTLDFLQPLGASLNRRWLIALAAVVITRLLHPLAPAPDSIVLLGVVGTAAAAMCGLPLLGGGWRGFSAVQFDQIQIAIHAFHPLGFWRIAGAVLAVNLLQLVAAFPIFLLAALFCFTPAPLAFGSALDYACRGLGFVAALQPLVLLSRFSLYTNDTSARGWFTVLLGLAFAAGGIAALVIAISLFSVESALVAFACLAALAALSSAVFFLYGVAWNRGWFDLIQVPRR